MKERGPGTDSPTRPVRSDAEALFREHGRYVAGFLSRLGVRGPDVDDLVQEVFLVVHRQGGHVAGPARPTTWLAEIALRVAMAARRKGRRTSLLSDPERAEGVPEHMTPHDELVHARAVRSVQAALDGLDLERRAIFVLYEMEGESCDAIAATFGIPVGTVYSRLHTARDEFLHAYARLVGMEPSSLRGGPAGSST
ncbi:MAG: RNA polymerase sigma factor [Deltaproteobacteria bacterium]|nr:RNA polymerase sigma factor [Deltaproteobacteria bacterium]